MLVITDLNPDSPQVKEALVDAMKGFAPAIAEEPVTE